MTAAVLEDLRGLTDTGLLPVYQEADDDAARRAVLAEAARRDQADRLAAARGVLAGIRAEAELAVHSQYLEADAQCRGRLLSRGGEAAGITEAALWRLPEPRVLRYASEELRDFWLYVQPRVTVAGYVRQHAAGARAARAEASEAAGTILGASSPITTREGTDGHRQDGPRLADADAGTFRFESPAAEAPQAGGRGAVQRGGRGGAEDDAGQLADAGTGRAGRPAQPAGGVRTMTTAFTTFDMIDPLPTEPLWPGFWPRGEVVGWYGEGGLGKGRAELDLAARITRGDPMPFCTGRTRPGSVILVLPEDHPSEQVRPRLDAAGADVSRVVDMTKLATGSRFKLSTTMTKDGDIGQLREAIETLRATCAGCRGMMSGGVCPACGGTDDMNPRLVIIDPLTAVIGWGSISTVAGARRAIEPLQDVAQNTGVTILLVMHSTKAGVLQGSAGIKQALRLLYKITKDVNPMVRVIGLEKGNNQGETPDAKFTLEDSAEGVKVIWLDRAEQDRRARSWREAAPKAGQLAGVRRLEPVPAPAPAAPASIAALVSTQAPWEPQARVQVLARYPDPQRGAELARRRCELHPAFRAAARWQQGADGDLLARYVADDGTVIRFAVAAMDDNYGTEAVR